uniref:Ig-like domain-containing protein n=1 Tax=Ditylenchus dipsaci TaxID=166011 RepID=A0A915E6B4_9BILA
MEFPQSHELVLLQKKEHSSRTPTIAEQPDGAVRENDYVTIKCESSSGNPTPKFTWIFDNKQLCLRVGRMRDRMWLLEAFSTIQWHVKSEDNGGYLTCQVWNQAMNASDDSKSTTTNRLNVHYSPRVQVGPLAELNVEEGDPIELHCKVDANPPAKHVEWLHPATVRRLPDEHWRMESVDRSKLHLNVLYGPKVSIKVVTEDQKAVTAQRINPAELSWTGPNGFKHNGTRLVISSISKAHVGQLYLQCRQHHGLPVQPPVKRQHQNSPAKLTRTLPSAKPLTAGDVYVSLVCEAQGYPAPSVDWYKDGAYISRDNKRWQVGSQTPVGSCEKNEFCPQTLSGSNLAISRPADSSVIKVTVAHEPVVLNQKFPDYALAAANLGTMARISCFVSARPEPRFTWTRNGEEITSKFEPHYSIRDSRLYDRLDEYESVLELSDVSEADFGSYYCQARNGNGGGVTPNKANVVPDPNHNSSAGSCVHLAAIGWKAGFDGGESQTFELEYRAVDPYTGQYTEEDSPTTFVFDGSNTTSLVYYSQEPTIRARRSLGESEGEIFAVHNLTKLRPMSSFWYRVRARNAMGISEWTAITSAVTLDAQESVGDGDLLAPESMLYLPDEHKMIVQPRKANGAHLTYSNHQQHNAQSFESKPQCLLLYALSEKKKRGFTEASTAILLVLEEIKLAERFKARYCYKHDLTTCSASLEIYVDTASMSNWATTSWKMVFAVLVGIISFTCSCYFCCNSNGALMKQRKRKGPKRLNLNGGVVVDRIDRMNEASQLPDTKNTVVHGSQADSGVFTLGSTQNGNGMPNGNPATGAAMNGNSNVGNEHSWPTNSNNNSDQQSDEDQPYDFSTDPYLQELSSQGIVVVENGYPQPEDHLTSNRRQFNPSSLRGTLNNNNFSHFFNNSQPVQRSSSATSSTHNGIQVQDQPDHSNGGGGSETASYNGGQPRVMREIIV